MALDFRDRLVLSGMLDEDGESAITLLDVVTNPSFGVVLAYFKQQPIQMPELLQRMDKLAMEGYLRCGLDPHVENGELVVELLDRIPHGAYPSSLYFWLSEKGWTAARAAQSAIPKKVWKEAREADRRAPDPRGERWVKILEEEDHPFE